MKLFQLLLPFYLIQGNEIIPYEYIFIKNYICIAFWYHLHEDFSISVVLDDILWDVCNLLNSKFETAYLLRLIDIIYLAIPYCIVDYVDVIEVAKDKN